MREEGKSNDEGEKKQHWIIHGGWSYCASGRTAEASKRQGLPSEEVSHQDQDPLFPDRESLT